MIIKGLNTATKLAMLILLVIVLNCSRRIYLHPPKQEKTSGAENGVVYMNDNSKQTKQVTSQSPQVVRVEYGKASYYADKFQGKPTASGELYDRDKLTAAHKTLPFGTLCRVTNTANKKSVIVRINDRMVEVLK